ncbi:MAG: DUF11 domain-containing protein [Patescibacteria group bacterium]|nr:DUF11 domain-containing protein [Patescibacteria group bacterium]
MNKIISSKKVLASAVLVLSVLGLVFFSLPVKADLVSIYTHPPADITANSAIVSGELSNLAGRNSASIWFEYGLTESYVSRTNNQVMNNTGTFQATLSGLNSCTLYHYRAAGDNGDGVVYGIDRTFSTLCSTNEIRVTLEAVPYSGPAPLDNVDLKADVYGRQAGDVHYWFDCKNDGSWDKELTIYQGPSSSYTSDNLCNYSSVGTYTARVRVERFGLTAENTASVTVTGTQSPVQTGGQYTLNVQKTVQNITSGSSFVDSVNANFGDELNYKIVITSSGQVSAPAVYVKDAMPAGISYSGGLIIDGVTDGRSIIDGILLDDIPAGTVKTITYRAKVKTQEFFNLGANNLVNSALVYNTGLSISDTATVIVVKGVVAGAATNVSTGLVDSLFGSLLLPLLLAGLAVWIFKSQIIGFDRWVDKRKMVVDDFRANQKLASLIRRRK